MPFPREYTLLIRDTIDIILVIIPKRWLNKMVIATVSPMILTIRELVDPLANLDNQDKESSIPKNKNKKSNSVTKSSYGSNITSHDFNTYNVYNCFKDENPPAWKNCSTVQYKSKYYHENKLKNASGNKRANRSYYAKKGN